MYLKYEEECLRHMKRNSTYTEVIRIKPARSYIMYTKMHGSKQNVARPSGGKVKNFPHQAHPTAYEVYIYIDTRLIVFGSSLLQ